MLRKFLPISLCCLLLTMVSCGFLGEKPDKRIEATFSFKLNNPTAEELEEALASLQKRFEKFGVTPDISSTDYANTYNFVMETSGDANIVEGLLTTPGNIEFYEVMDNDVFQKFLLDASARFETDDEEVENEFISKFGIPGSNAMYGPVHISEEHIAEMNSYLKMPGVLAELGDNKGKVRFLYGRKDEVGDTRPLFALMLDKSRQPALSGNFITNANMSYSPTNEPRVDLNMDEKAALKWEAITGRAYEQHTQIAIVIDQEVYSAPGVSSGPIKGGRSSIQGDFTEEEAQILALVINSEPIPEVSMSSFTVQELIP